MSPHCDKTLTFPVEFVDIPSSVISFGVSREDAIAALGEPMLIDIVDGLGLCDFWAYEYPCGLQVAYRYHQVANFGIAFADSPEIAHVARHAPFPTTLIQCIDDEILYDQVELLLEAFPDRREEIENLKAFQVWREDDNGNQFEVGDPTSKRDAECWVNHFNSLHHKQTYWLDRVRKD